MVKCQDYIYPKRWKVRLRFRNRIVSEFKKPGALSAVVEDAAVGVEALESGFDEDLGGERKRSF